jgi:hypothetical protein
VNDTFAETVYAPVMNTREYWNVMMLAAWFGVASAPPSVPVPPLESAVAQARSTTNEVPGVTDMTQYHPDVKLPTASRCMKFPTHAGVAALHVTVVHGLTVAREESAIPVSRWE